VEEAFVRLDGCGGDPELVALCKRCLAADREARPKDAGEVASAVAALRSAADERARKAEVARAEAVVRETEGRKRRRVLLVGPLTIVGSLLLGIGVSVWQAVRAADAEQKEVQRRGEAEVARADAVELAERERQAKEREADERRKAGDLAEKEKQNAERITAQRNQIRKGFDLIAAIFSDVDIRSSRIGTVPLDRLLAERITALGGQLTAENVGGSETEVARLKSRLGLTLLNLGSHADAIRILEQSTASLRKALGEDDPDTVASANNLGLAYLNAIRPADAIPLFEHGVRVREKRHGPASTLALVSRHNLATAYIDAGQPGKAVPILRAAVGLWVEKLGSDSPDALVSRQSLGVALWKSGERREAAATLEEVLRLSAEKAGPLHPDTLTTAYSLGTMYLEYAQPEKAVPHFERCVKGRKRTLSPTHPDTLMAMFFLSQGYRLTGKLAAAAQTVDEMLEYASDGTDPAKPLPLEVLCPVALVYQQAGRPDDAVKALAPAAARILAKRGKWSDLELRGLTLLAACHRDTRRYTEAVPLLDAVFRAQTKALGESDEKTLYTEHELGTLYREMGKSESGAPHWEHILEVVQKRNPPFREPPWFISSAAGQLAVYYESQKDNAKAAKYRPDGSTNHPEGAKVAERQREGGEVPRVGEEVRAEAGAGDAPPAAAGQVTRRRACGRRSQHCQNLSPRWAGERRA
jgi:tetratricopeptide (TPR) repeat protein